jgi:hypothetical protein
VEVNERTKRKRTKLNEEFNQIPELAKNHIPSFSATQSVGRIAKGVKTLIQNVRETPHQLGLHLQNLDSSKNMNLS